MRRRRALQVGGGLLTGMCAGCLRSVRATETYQYEREAPINGPVAIPWRTQAYDARRSGYTPYGRLPLEIAVGLFASARQPIRMQPAFVGGIAYFGATHVDPDRLRWRAGLRAADSRARGWISHQKGHLASPTVVGDAIFVTSRGLTRALDRRNGRLCWAYHEGTSHPPASPTVVDETVYVTGERVFALDAATGEVRWGTNRSDTTLRGTAATTDGVFATGGSDDRGTVYRFDPETGRERWATATSDAVLVPPVLDDLVYVVEAEGRLRALSPADGSEAWSRELDGRSTAMPAVAAGTVYAVATAGNTLYAFDAATGERRWEFGFDARRAIGPTIAGDTVYLPTGDGGNGVVHAVEAETGTSIRSQRLPREPVSSLVVGVDTGLIAAGLSSETHLYVLSRPEP